MEKGGCGLKGGDLAIYEAKVLLHGFSPSFLGKQTDWFAPAALRGRKGEF
jgi:hypothetical protein